MQASRLKVLAVAAEQRAKGFDKVPTFKERGIDLSLGAWRGLCAPKAVQEPAYRKTLDKLNLGATYADAASFRAAKDRDSQAFKVLASKLEIKS